MKSTIFFPNGTKEILEHTKSPMFVVIGFEDSSDATGVGKGWGVLAKNNTKEGADQDKARLDHLVRRRGTILLSGLQICRCVGGTVDLRRNTLSVRPIRRSPGLYCEICGIDPKEGADLIATIRFGRGGGYTLKVHSKCLDRLKKMYQIP